MIHAKSFLNLLDNSISRNIANKSQHGCKGIRPRNDPAVPLLALPNWSVPRLVRAAAWSSSGDHGGRAASAASPPTRQGRPGLWRDRDEGYDPMGREGGGDISGAEGSRIRDSGREDRGRRGSQRGESGERSSMGMDDSMRPRTGEGRGGVKKSSAGGGKERAATVKGKGGGTQQAEVVRDADGFAINRRQILVADAASRGEEEVGEVTAVFVGKKAQEAAKAAFSRPRTIPEGQLLK